MHSDMPFTALAGYMIVACTCLAISLSVALSGSNFSPFDYWIEDFGIAARNPSGAFVYDIGFVFAGLFLCILSMGFKIWYNRGQWHNTILIAAQIAGAISGMVLIAEGITLMLGNDQPMVWSTSFFLSAGIAITLACLCMLLRRDENEDTICVGATSIALIVLLAATSYLNVTPVITEWLAVISMLVWAAMIARDMSRHTLATRAGNCDQAQTPATG
jgi:hypothetical protein